MTKKQRVKDSIDRKPVDFIPYNVELTSEEMRNFEKAYGISRELFDDWAGNHIEKFTCSVPDRQIGEGLFEDEYGVVWNRTIDKDIGIVEELIFPEAEMRGYKFPAVDEDYLREKIGAFVSNGKDTYKFAKINFSLFERAWSMRGFENTLIDFLCNEEFIHSLMEQITQRNIKILEIVCEYPVDGIYFGDDYGQQTGMLMSPDIWRTAIKPYLARMFAKAKAYGKQTCLHSCGNILPIIPDLIEIGLDAYQTVQPEIYDLKKLKAEFGKDICFFGGISTQRELPHESAAFISKLVRDTLKTLGDTGYIAAPTHKVPKDVPPENIVALILALKAQGNEVG